VDKSCRRPKNGWNHCLDDVKVLIPRETFARSRQIFPAERQGEGNGDGPAQHVNRSVHRKCGKNIFHVILILMTADLQYFTIDKSKSESENLVKNLVINQTKRQLLEFSHHIRGQRSMLDVPIQRLSPGLLRAKARQHSRHFLYGFHTIERRCL
jgi:hypothetical protein